MESLNLSKGERRISTSSSLSAAFSNRSEDISPDSSYERGSSSIYPSHGLSRRNDGMLLDRSVGGTSYKSNHQFNSSLDSSAASLSYDQGSPRVSSPTPSNFSTTSSASKQSRSGRRGSISDNGSGRVQKRPNSRNMRAGTTPYSRESSLGPGVEMNRALTQDDSGLAELLAITALKSNKKVVTKKNVIKKSAKKLDYDSEWSDGSFKTTSDDSDSDSDSDDQLDEDFDIELEEEQGRDQDGTYGKKKGKQRASILSSPTKNSLDVRLEDGSHLDINVSPEEKAKVTEVRRIAFEQMAGAFRAASTASARDKARGAFVQAWLAYSYEEHPGGNVCRPAIYGSYCQACVTASVTPINSASFGKAMRQAFPKVKTRRLGVRGNSRYHYCGIAPTNATELAILIKLTAEGSEDPDDSAASSNGERKPKSKTRRKSILEMDPQEYAIKLESDLESEAESISSIKSAKIDVAPVDSPVVSQTPKTARPTNPDQPVSMKELQDQPPAVIKPKKTRSKKPIPISVPSTGHESDRGDMEKTLGGKATKSIPITLRPIEELLRGYPDIEDALRNTGEMEVNEDVVRRFWREYAETSYALLENMRKHEYDKFESTIAGFWKTIDQATGAVVQHPTISTYIYRADAAIYDNILDYLHSQILAPLPPSAFLALRKISENMEQLQSDALAVFSANDFSGPKIELAARFGHLVSRHLGLCQLAQAMMNIVSDRGAMKTLAEAWELIDLEAVKNQSALVSNCAHELLTECFDRFKQLLQQPGPSPTESIILWAEQVYRTAITSSSANSQSTSPRSLLIRFNFVTSQIIRDLVLRSEPSFGSWQIISLFLDEFLAFQILRKVALEISGISLEPPVTLSPELFKTTPELDFSYYSMESAPMQGSVAPNAEISSIAPSSSNFPSSFDQFSPNTRNFIDRAAGEMQQSNFNNQLQQQNYTFSQPNQSSFSHYDPSQSQFGSFASSMDLGQTTMGLGIGGMSPYQTDVNPSVFTVQTYGAYGRDEERLTFERYDGFDTQSLF